MEKRPALGKGLSALIPDMPDVRPVGGTTEVDVDQISPNDHQPRHRFEDARLDELAQSIKKCSRKISAYFCSPLGPLCFQKKRCSKSGMPPPELRMTIFKFG